MNLNEKGKEARARLMESDPGFVEGIDALKSRFGARLTAIQVGDISIGNIRGAFKTWEEAPEFVSYRRPEEIAEEWEEIKGAERARAGTRRRASAGKH